VRPSRGSAHKQDLSGVSDATRMWFIVGPSSQQCHRTSIVTGASSLIRCMARARRSNTHVQTSARVVEQDGLPRGVRRCSAQGATGAAVLAQARAEWLCHHSSTSSSQKSTFVHSQQLTFPAPSKYCHLIAAVTNITRSLLQQCGRASSISQSFTVMLQ